MRSMGEGHRRVLLTFWRGDTLNLPLHHPADGPPPRAGEELVNPARVLLRMNYGDRNYGITVTGASSPK
jgi:hypothetical protein